MLYVDFFLQVLLSVSGLLSAALLVAFGMGLAGVANS